VGSSLVFAGDWAYPLAVAGVIAYAVVLANGALSRAMSNIFYGPETNHKEVLPAHTTTSAVA
jgi:hypothetical protein